MYAVHKTWGIRMSFSMKAAVLAAATVAALPALGADQGLIDKGRALFNDTKLSGDGKFACATCHPNNGHTNNKTYIGTGVVKDGDPMGRSTPTLWGAGKRSVYSWAGTVPKIEPNIRGIIVNRMKGAEPSPDTLAALAAYIGSLPPKPKQIDENGVPADAAPADVKRGFALFTGAGGCGACHVPGTFDKADPEDIETGGKFKVPSLWAVSQTAPYFHDGRAKDLSSAAAMMWAFNGRKTGKLASPTNEELADLVAYLKAL